MNVLRGPSRSGGSLLALLAAVSGLTALSPCSLADRTKADNIDTLNLATSWLDGIPGPTERAIFDNTLHTNALFSLGDDAQAWLGIKLLNPSNTITIAAGNTLALGSGGIDLSTATKSLTLNNNLSLNTAQSWNTATTLTIAGTVSGSAIIYWTLPAGNVAQLGHANPSASVPDFSAFSGTLDLGASAGTLCLQGTFAGSSTDLHLGNAAINLGSGSAILATRNGGHTQSIGALSGGPQTSLHGAIAPDAAYITYAIGGANTSTTFQGTIVDGAVAGSMTNILKTGTGTLTLTNSNSSYSGTLTIQKGAVIIPNLLALGTGAAAIQLGAAASEGTLRYTGSASSSSRLFTILGSGAIDSSGTGPLSLSGGAVTWGSSNQPRTLTLAGSNTTLNTFSDTINNNGNTGIVSLVKSGPGTWKVNANSSYTGGTTINQGTILTTNNAGQNPLGTGPIVVNSSATFAAAGPTAADITINAGGHFSPGNPTINSGVGIATVHNFTMNAGSFLDLDFLDSPPGTPSSNDLVSIVNDGILTLGNPVNVNLFQAGTANPYSTPGNFTIFTGINASAGFVGSASNLHVNNTVSATSYGFALVSATDGTSNIVLTIATATGPVTGTWIGPSSPGDWSVSGNWQGGSIPTAAGDSAIFGPAGFGGTVNLNAQRHLASISFATGSSASYTLASGSGGKLFMDNGTGNASISLSSGSHTIATNLELDSPTTISLSAGTTLTLTGLLNPPGGPLGSPLSLTGTGQLILSAGSAHKLSDLSLANTVNGTNVTYSPTLNLSTDKLIIEATGGADKTAKINALNTAISSGANGATWTGAGITSSAAQSNPNHYGVGVFDNAILNKTSFGGQSADTNSIFATAAHLGDANDDGIVNIQDISIVANNWQHARNNWAQGDMNRDGTVNIQDFSIVANNWQQSSTLSLTALTPVFSAQPVPEPGMLLLLSLPLTCISLVRRNGKQSRLRISHFQPLPPV